MLFLQVLLASFAAVALYYGVLVATLGRRWPQPRRKVGEVILTLALVPWVAWGVLLMLGIALGWWKRKGYP